MAVGLAGEAFALRDEFRETPLRSLRITSRSKLAQYLDPDGVLTLVGDGLDIVNNYNGLAELIGFSYLEIRNFMRKSSPTKDLLESWTSREMLNPTLGRLWEYLYQMERVDVLTDCYRTVVRDAEVYYEQKEMEEYDFPIQDPEVSNTEEEEMAIDDMEGAVMDDIRYGTKTIYDAFVSYNPEPEDLRFVKNMIRNLEGRHNLKLFIPGRDDVPGAAKFVVTAGMIEQRCRRVVIVMSHNFHKSVACDFQIKFAHALAPGARSKTLIPVVIEKNTPMPRILKFLTVCDFTKNDMEDWVWERLSLAVKAPLPGPSNRRKPEPETTDRQALSDISLEISGNYNHASLRQSSDSVSLYSGVENRTMAFSSTSSFAQSSGSMSYHSRTGNRAQSFPAMSATAQSTPDGQYRSLETSGDYGSAPDRQISDSVSLYSRSQNRTQPFPAASSSSSLASRQSETGVQRSHHQGEEEISHSASRNTQPDIRSREIQDDLEQAISSSEDVHFV